LAEENSYYQWVEYTLGEALDTPGHVLKSISADKVTIEDEVGRARVEIPLQDY